MSELGKLTTKDIDIVRYMINYLTKTGHIVMVNDDVGIFKPEPKDADVDYGCRLPKVKPPRTIGGHEYQNPPRQNSIVEFTEETKWYQQHRWERLSENLKEFFSIEQFIFLGEIPNSPGRCVVVSAVTGKVFLEHTSLYKEIAPEGEAS